MNKPLNEQEFDLTLSEDGTPDTEQENVDRTRIATRPKAAQKPLPCLGRIKITQCPPQDDRALGTTYEFRGPELSIGRDPANVVALNDQEASKFHAKIIRQAGNNVIIDLASTNGTFVNGARVSEHILRRGDTIMTGATAFQYEPA